MKVVTPQQMNEIDRISIKEIGIPGVVLMENAALKVVEEVLKDFGDVHGKNIVLLAGKGNNGGDAFAVARHLYNKGAETRVYILTDKANIAHDAKVNLNAIENMGIHTEEILKESQICCLENQLEKTDLVIDGIFGTGLKGEVAGVARNVISKINCSKKPVLSIDIPSGICGISGKILGVCIKAYKTVTFALPKQGLLVHPATECTGEVVVADIGVPSKVIDRMNINSYMIDSVHVSRLIPTRKADSNKGSYGKVLIVSGSIGMTGAGVMSAGAALRTGAGLVYLGVPSSLVSVYDSALAEAVTIPLQDEGTGVLSEKSIEQIEDVLHKMSVVAVGPGLSTNGKINHIVTGIIERSDVPLVLDADALNIISQDVSVLGRLRGQAVVTPHPGEMSRLVGLSIEDIQNNRIDVARDFAIKWNVTVVLKGFRTVVSLPDGTFYINTTGNSGMATGGTGDVLTGTIAGLIGQGLTPSDAAVAGVYIHGFAGDRVAEIMGKHGMIASDIIRQLPEVLKQISNNF